MIWWLALIGGYGAFTVVVGCLLKGQPDPMARWAMAVLGVCLAALAWF